MVHTEALEYTQNDINAELKQASERIKYRMEHIDCCVRVQDGKKRRKTKEKWIKVETSKQQQVDEMHTTFFLTIRHEIKYK